ncbi:hypothetical protein F2Q69_00000601 [Brassica cretica]|uniref:DUF1985 domain-containing protein n=1 Tax=Brassica cretica TaxID=69181 RepID=A0A8S9NVM8_BRACR|nr:hypothetical protein F2Q69_00000601 [Brassica cretica]
MVCMSKKADVLWVSQNRVRLQLSNSSQPGEETQVHQINNNCKMVRYFKRLMEWLPKELETVKKDPVFAQIFKLFDNGLGFSARVIHGFLCRELLTYKDHELWFVFARS